MMNWELNNNDGCRIGNLAPKAEHMGETPTYRNERDCNAGSCLGVWHSDAIDRNDATRIALTKIRDSQITNIQGRVLKQAR